MPGALLLYTLYIVSKIQNGKTTELISNFKIFLLRNTVRQCVFCQKKLKGANRFVFNIYNQKTKITKNSTQTITIVIAALVMYNSSSTTAVVLDALIKMISS